MVDEQKLRQLAESAKGWAIDKVHQDQEDLNMGIALVGGENDDGSFAKVMSIETGLYFAEEKAALLAHFYAVANPAAILSLLDELQTLREERDSMLQAITDPENQPSQYGTVTMDYHAQKVSELSDKHNTSVDALISAREERTAWRVTAENAEAAVKQARIDALEEAAAICQANASMCSEGVMRLTLEANADAIESLKGKT